jgi:mycothione reductase
MEKYDLIVVGGGSGINVASNAANKGLKVCLIERSQLGGTCTNNGCVPSKMLIYPADVIRVLQDARAVGIKGANIEIDFPMIMSRMRSAVDNERTELEEALKSSENAIWYHENAEFVGDYVLKAGASTVTAPKIVIATGSRPAEPPIQGLKESGSLDNISVLNLSKPPQSLIILGGGYLGCEYGHFFSAMGTEVTIIGRNPRLLPNEDPEISDIVKKVMSKNLKVLTDHEVNKVEVKNGVKIVTAKDMATGKEIQYESEQIMKALGRKSNSDTLKPEKTGVDTDKKGWIRVNEYLETSKPGIWALGDAVGKHMFKHTANYEADIVWHNITSNEKEKADYHAVPHAVFTHPQVGAVGLTEKKAKSAGKNIMVGRARYTDVVKGFAMAEDDSLVKAVVEEGSEKILGCSIVGSEAPILIQQIVFLMNCGKQDLEPFRQTQVIHPTLSEVLIHAFLDALRPKSTGYEESSENR